MTTITQPLGSSHFGKCNVRRRNAKRTPTISAATTTTTTQNSSSVATTSITSNRTVEEEKLPFGLRRVDYTKGPGPRWPIPVNPPDDRNVVHRNLSFILTAGLLLACGIVYFYWDESVLDYWQAVERGDVPIEGLDDDDDYDLLDDDEDEWEQDKEGKESTNKTIPKD